MELKDFLTAVKTDTWSDASIDAACVVCKSRRVCLLEYPDTTSLYFANMTVQACLQCGISYVPTRPKGLDYYYRHIYTLEKRRAASIAPEEMFGGKYDRYLAPDRSADHIDTIRRQGGEFRSLLDVGAGYGMTLKVSGADQKVAVEVDQSMMPYLAHIGAQVFPSIAGMENASFDAVMSSHYLEHLFIADVYANVREMLRVMKPLGVGLIEVPNAPLLHLDTFQAKHTPHTVFFSLESLVRILETCGARILETAERGKEYPLKLHPQYQPSEKYDAKTQRILLIFKNDRPHDNNTII